VALADGEVTENRGVVIQQSGPDQDVLARVAELQRRGAREGGGIEPGSARPDRLWIGHRPDYVRTVRGADRIQSRSIGGDAEEVSGFGDEDAVESPVPRDAR